MPPNGQRRASLLYRDAKPLPLASHGEGIYIWDVNGKRYIDGCSGAINANLGHGNKRVQEATNRQLDKIAFTYRTQFESDPANELAELVCSFAPPELNRVFFATSGSEGVETAIKLARQYWWSVGKQGKRHIIARTPSYHGATLGALGLTSYAPLNIPFQNIQVDFPHIAAPYCYHCPLGLKYPSCQVTCAMELENTIRRLGADNVAGFIFEPFGGASTGGIVPPDEYHPMIERICQKFGVLMISDDVLTGCGRTGKFFGFEHWDVTPDIVVLSKGISGGYAPMAAVLTSDEIATPILDSGGFMHGHTFAGNPLSAAVCCEVLKIIREDGLVENSAAVGAYLHERLHDLKERHTIIGDVRGRGLLSGIEFVAERETRAPWPKEWMVGQQLTTIAREMGLLIYPRRSLWGLEGDHVLITPPLIVTREQIDEIIGIFERALEELEQWIAAKGVAPVVHLLPTVPTDDPDKPTSPVIGAAS